MKTLFTISLILFSQQLLASQFGNWTRHADRNQYRVDTPIVEVTDNTLRLRVDRGKKSQPGKHRKQEQKRQHAKHRKHDAKKYHRTDRPRQDHQYSYRPAKRWQSVTAFRGRSGRDVTRHLNVQERVKALSIQATKRGMYIRRAHALLGNGRWIRVEGLEGHVNLGERVNHRLSRDRYVKQVVLDIEPSRSKRGYAELLVRPAD